MDKKKKKTAMSNCTIRLHANTQRTSKNGSAPLYIRLRTKMDGYKKIPIGISWPEKKIDIKNNRILPRFPNDPDYQAYQAKIEMETSKFRVIINSMMLSSQPYGLHDIIERAGVYRFKQGFLAYMDHKIKCRLRERKLKYSSSRSHKVTYHHIKKFLKGKDVPVSGIDSCWIEKFVAYLAKIKVTETTYMADNTIWNRVKELKTYLALALKDKLEVNPDYKNYENPKIKSRPVYLHDDELRRLMQFYIDPLKKKSDKRIAAAFIFACFTGLRISDLKRWHKSWIEGDTFRFVPEKQVINTQHTELVIPLTPVTKNIIDDLDGDTFGLPSDQKFNKGLKRLAKQCNISKNLTSHVGRHTCGMLMACSGAPVLVIADLLGHKKMETTLTYTHISDQTKRREMMKIDAAFEDWGISQAKK